MWKDKISECFGSADLVFANHPTELKASAELLHDLLTNSVMLHELENAIREWLTSRMKTKESVEGFDWEIANQQIDEQLTRVRKLFTPWLI